MKATSFASEGKYMTYTVNTNEKYVFFQGRIVEENETCQGCLW